MNNEIAARIISRMTFSAADYAKNRDQIIKEAVSMYTQQTGEVSSKVQAGLTVLMDRSFIERKELSICAAELPDHLKDGSSFRIFLDNTEVVGQLRLSPKEISVEISSPFHDGMAGAELEMLAPVIWTMRPEPGSEANEEGRRKAIILLADIYYSLLR